MLEQIDILAQKIQNTEKVLELYFFHNEHECMLH